MKKTNFLSLLIMAFVAVCFTSCETYRMIECDTVDETGARVRITSADRICSGCKLRICQYTESGKQPLYGLELDVENRVIRARKGNLLTIQLADGKSVVLKNLYDTKSEQTETVENETTTNFYTSYVPVYDAWYDAVYTVPVTDTYRTSRPVVRTESLAKLYYLITPEQVNQIVQSEVTGIVIATDSEPIRQRPRGLSDSVRELFGLFQ